LKLNFVLIRGLPSSRSSAPRLRHVNACQRKTL
jgi:hypothetical protein